MLLPELDLNRCVESALVTDLPLAFKQSSFAHVTQV